MPVFTAVGAAIFGAGSFLAGATAFGLQVGAGIGLNLLAQQLAGRQTTPAAAVAPVGPGMGVQGRIAAAGDHPRSFPVGYRVTAGSLVYANTWGNVNGAPNGYLTQVIALSDLPLESDDDGLVGLFVNGERCTIDWGNSTAWGYPVEEYFAEGIDGDDKDHLWIIFHDGTQSTADSFLTGTVASGGRPYQSTRVGTGVAYAIVTARVNDKLFTGFPQFRFELSGIPLYDPSKDTTVGGSGSQRWDTPSTWGGDGDDLPAVQLYNLRRGITYGGAWLYGLQGMSAARLPADNWIAQIEKCRAAVNAPGGGTEPRYRSSAEISVANELAATDEALLTACQGRICEVGGVYKLYCGAPGDAVMEFTDDDIISTEEQSFTPFFGLSDTITGITANYPSPDEAWNTRAAKPIYRSDYEALAGNRRLLADVSLDCVPYKRQVQQLMREALQEAQRARRHTFTLPPRFWPLEPGDVVEWTSERNGYEAKLFRVDGVIDKANLDVIVDLTEVDPDDYDWDTGTHYVAPVIGPTTIERPAAQPIVDFDATAIEITGDTPGVSRPGILLSWDVSDEEALDDVAAVAYEVRRDSDNEVLFRGRTDNPAAGEVPIEGNGLLPDTVYGVRARLVPDSPRAAEWSGWIAVTTLDIRFAFPDFTTQHVEYLTSHFNNEIARIKDQVQRIAAGAVEQDAHNYYDRKEAVRLLHAATGAFSAQIKEVMTVITTNEGAFASYQLEVAASFAATNASVTVNAGAIATLDGYAAARYSVMLDVNGYGTGFELFNGGATYSFARFSVDYFQVAKPGVSGGDPITIFEISTISGSPGISLRGNLIADGAIVARTLAANSVVANNIVAGTITGSKLAAATITGDRISAGTITGDRISADTIETENIKSEAATALFTATGADNDNIDDGEVLVEVTCNIVNGEVLALFTAEPILEKTAPGGAADTSGFVEIDFYVDGVATGNAVKFKSTNTYNGSAHKLKLRHPMTMMAVISGITPGTRDISAVMTNVNAFDTGADSESIHTPVIAILESRR